MYAMSAIKHNNQSTEESTIKRSPVPEEGHTVAALTAYRSSTRVKVKVLEFVKRSEPSGTEPCLFQSF